MMFGADLVQHGIAGHLLLDGVGLGDLAGTRSGDGLGELRVGQHRGEVDRGLVDLRGQFADRLDRDLHLLMTEQHGTEHDLFRQAARLGLHHQHGVLGAGDDQVQIAVRAQADDGGVQDVLTVLVADPGRADGTVERHPGNRERRGGPDQGRDLRIDRRVQRLDRGNHLDFVGEAIGEQGPDRAVDQTRGQDLALARAALTAEEAAGDAAGRVGLFLVIDGERQEIALRARLLAHHHGDQHHGVAHVDEYGAIGLAGDLAGLQGDGLVAELKLLNGCGGNHWSILGSWPRGFSVAGAAGARHTGDWGWPRAEPEAWV